MGKIILGLIAKQGGGKGSAAVFLKKRFKAASHRFSDPVRELADLRGIEQSRANLQKLAQDLRKVFGEAVLEKEIIRRCLIDPSYLTIADGIREPGDIKNLLLRDDFHVISLEVGQVERYNRLKKRGENSGETEMTWTEFLEAENHVNEKAIDETLAILKAKQMHEGWRNFHTISNEGTPEELETLLSKVVQGIYDDNGLDQAEHMQDQVIVD